MTEIVYLVRHGQTIFNRDKRLQGWKDSPLSEKGEGHAANVGQAISGFGIQEAWVSPLGRAQQTAGIIQEVLGFEIKTLDELREVSFGDFEGNTMPEIDEKFPGQWRARQDDKWNYCPPNGESNKDAMVRVEKVAQMIDGRKETSPLLIIAHFAINRLIVSYMTGLSPDEAMRMNVLHETVYRLERDGDCWKSGYQFADQVSEGFIPGWLPQEVSENQPVSK